MKPGRVRLDWIGTSEPSDGGAVLQLARSIGAVTRTGPFRILNANSRFPKFGRLLS